MSIFVDYETGSRNHILLAADRGERGAAMGQIREVPAGPGVGARDIYAGESGDDGSGPYAGGGDKPGAGSY